MPSVVDRIMRYAKGPQGRKMRAKAERYARDPARRPRCAACSPASEAVAAATDVRAQGPSHPGRAFACWT